MSVKLVRAPLFVAAAFAAVVATLSPPFAADKVGSVKLALEIDIDGAIGPATARYVKEALATADERRAEIVILRLNTPGGLVTSMREIIADVLASRVPVVGFVSPSGAHAASAGTYILYATHVAAMAPGTNLGAATPVEIGAPMPGLPGPPDKKDQSGSDKGVTPAPSQDAMTAKMTNDAVAFIRSLAELRGRNADWAEEAVREASSLSANAALKAGAIDLIAGDTTELLAKIDGRTVAVNGGAPEHLATRGLTIETLQPGWLIRLLSVITDPNVAVILMLVGVYGLIFEFTSPGAVAPGVVGTIALLLGLYALNLLPIDYAGLVLMLLGLTFLIVEAFNPTVVLGLGGLAAFLLGTAMLFKVEAPGFRLSPAVVGVAAMLVFALVALVGRALWRARRRQPRVGGEAMQGLPAKILDWRAGEGHVRANGERWQARGDETFTPGETVEVATVSGLTLMVRRRSDTATAEGEPP
ncbi:nodulation protein NfeD [Hyphomicrobium sp.]|uniref:NfeD family protein n=1 Tax=Hyphomicrobium sp. TaxID=82 RepID=UPI000F95CD92|nr:nodulation protein NfeD [Hyphomicrobium sp.]RUP10544.1 MAG: nodulation protein NfeD [Hyphomicrobium sp.]